MDGEAYTLPPHVERTVRAIALLHEEHHQQATRVESVVDRATALIGSPDFLGVLTLFVLLWIAVNVSLIAFGRIPFDPPPFQWLTGGLSLAAIYIGTLILTTQRRAGRLASRREQMTLELGMMNEQKVAKIIQLLEELRFDSPEVKNRIDDEANAMATPADPRAVLDAIADTRHEMHAQHPSETQSSEDANTPDRLQTLGK